MFYFISIISLMIITYTNAEVFVLDDSNFDKTLSEHSPMLVEFYAPWCGHCKALEPEYEEADEILQEKNAEVFLGKVDSTAENCAELTKRFGIRGFPTLKYFSSSSTKTPVDYEGEREADDIVKWLEKKIGPAFITIKNEADLNKMKSSVTSENEKVVVVGVFANKEQSIAFETIAKNDLKRDYYVIMDDKLLASKLDKSPVPFIQVLRSFNISNPAMNSNANEIGDQSKLEKFLASASEVVSLVVTYNENDFETTIKTGTHVIEIYAPWCGYCKQFAPEYEKVAEHYLNQKNNKLVIAKFDGTTNDEITAKEGVESFPTIKIYKNGVAAFFKGEFNEDSVIEFIEEKLVATAQALPNDEASISKFVKNDDPSTTLVACVTEKNDDVIDLVAFQSGSSEFKVGRSRCKQGSEHVDLYNNAGTKTASYPSTSSISDIASLRKWYKRASLKPVFRFDDEYFEQIMGAEYSNVLFFFSTVVNENDKEIQLFETLAKEDKYPNTAYTYASGSEDYLLQFFGLTANDLPALRLLELSGSMPSFIGPNEVSENSIKEMFEQYSQGVLLKVIQPTQNDDNEDDTYSEDHESEDDETDFEEKEDEEEEFQEDDEFGEDEDSFEEEEDQDEL